MKQIYLTEMSLLRLLEGKEVLCDDDVVLYPPKTSELGIMRTKIVAHFTWKDFEKACDILYIKIKQSGIEYENVYGLPRGGIPLAVKLSHKLKIPLIVDMEEITDNTLIVDDICDTGESLKDFADEGLDIAVIHIGSKSKVKPKYYAYPKSVDWIVYAWETEETSE